MTIRKARVLVVDDSAFARKVIREVLSDHPAIEVVGIARDGLDALEKIAELAPDVVTLDLVMPELDGLGVLRALAERPAPPRVVIVTMTDEDSDLGVAARRSGAFDVVHKPTAIATDRLYELGEELRSKVLAAAASSTGHVAPPSTDDARFTSSGQIAADLVVIGASTGGPAAITRLLSALPATFPVPIAVVLHMPPGYTAALAKRLDGDCQLDVFEAREDLPLIAGRVAVARGGMHLKLARDATGYRTQLDILPLDTLHRPSVDVLFASAAAVSLGPVLGVVLTGMGNDGTVGARAIRERGGSILTESESSCVVYGMPRSVVEAGLSDQQAPLESIASLLVRSLS